MPANAHYPSDARGPRMASAGGFFRRRRVLFLGTIIAIGFFLFYVPWELPEPLQGVDVSRANFVSRVKKESPKIDEVYGLLHIVTGDDEQEHVLNNPQLDPTSPLDLSVYAPGFSLLDWVEVQNKLDKEYPVIVFSKTWCPYSKLAKKILAAYDLKPPPKIIELDLRDDGGVIKALLTRLTGQSTVPNVLLRGKSIGGASDIYPLSTEGLLAEKFKEAGAIPQADGSKFRNEEAS